MAGEAARLGILGWVRNRRDGAVEALVQGPEREVEAMIEWARRGPSLARVTALEVGLDDSNAQYRSFERLPTT